MTPELKKLCRQHELQAQKDLDRENAKNRMLEEEEQFKRDCIIYFRYLHQNNFKTETETKIMDVAYGLSKTFHGVTRNMITDGGTLGSLVFKYKNLDGFGHDVQSVFPEIREAVNGFTNKRKQLIIMARNLGLMPTALFQ